MLIHFIVRRNNSNTLSLSKHAFATVADLLKEVNVRLAQYGLASAPALQLEGKNLEESRVLYTLPGADVQSTVTVDIAG